MLVPCGAQQRDMNLKNLQCMAEHPSPAGQAQTPAHPRPDTLLRQGEMVGINITALEGTKENDGRFR